MDIRLDNIYNIDCIEGMKCIDADSIDCVVTSPPYDNMRTYDGVADGWNFEKFQQIAQQLFRVMKDGGMVAWVVADATIDGSETGSSFRQALYFKEVGFNLVDTMIYKKHGTPPIGSTKWYFNCFEYIFILSKGKMRECNLIRDVPARQDTYKQTRKRPDGTVREIIHKNEYHFKRRTNIWEYGVGNNLSTKDKYAFKHPAIFPEKLAHDLIFTMSNEGDVVLEPFLGSGTTAKMAIGLHRHYIGFELNPDYFEIAKQRIADIERQPTLF